MAQELTIKKMFTKLGLSFEYRIIVQLGPMATPHKLLDHFQTTYELS